MLSKISESLQETILLGDLNANFLKQEDKELKAVLRVFGLKQMITKPTGITGSCESLLDVILTNSPASLKAKILISQSQFGFRPKIPTELAPTLLFDNIQQHVDEGKLVDATFIDLSMAFDTISHSNLMKKLPQYGYSDKELRWFTDYLFQRSMVVSYGSCLFAKREILTGIPQGLISGPLLFILFCNDIADVVDTAEIVIYANGTVIYVTGKDVTITNIKLNKEMDDIAKWLDQNALIIKLKKGKTESLHFGTPQRITKQNKTLTVMYLGVKILNTSQYKYLGIEADSPLNLNCHCERYYKRALSRLSLLGS